MAILEVSIIESFQMVSDVPPHHVAGMAVTGFLTIPVMAAIRAVCGRLSRP